MAEINLVAQRQLRGFIALSNPVSRPQTAQIKSSHLQMTELKSGHPQTAERVHCFIKSSRPWSTQIKSNHHWMTEIKSGCPQTAERFHCFIKSSRPDQIQSPLDGRDQIQLPTDSQEVDEFYCKTITATHYSHS